MPTYIYLPVSTPEMQKVAKDWNDVRAAQQKAPYPIIRNPSSGLEKAVRRALGEGYLRHVQNTDKLYVLSHGLASATSGGALAIGNKRGGTLKNEFVGGLKVIGGEYKMYNDAKFARHLEEEGLSKQFVDLRLFCCCAGLGATHKGNPLAPFAARLKNSLYNRGFQQITVTGYLGDLAVSGAYFKSGAIVMDAKSHRGDGPNVRVAGEQLPMHFKDHAVKF